MWFVYIIMYYLSSGTFGSGVVVDVSIYMCRSDDDELARSTGRFMWYKVMSLVLIFHSYTSVSDSGKGSSIAPSAVSSRRSSRNIAKSPSMDSILKYRTITESPSMDSMLKYQNIAVSPTDSMGRRSSDLAISDQGGLRKVKKQGTLL